MTPEALWTCQTSVLGEHDSMMFQISTQVTQASPGKNKTQVSDTLHGFGALSYEDETG